MIQEENKPCSEAAFRWLVFRIFDIKWQKSIVNGVDILVHEEYSMYRGILFRRKLL